MARRVPPPTLSIIRQTISRRRRLTPRGRTPSTTIFTRAERHHQQSAALPDAIFLAQRAERYLPS